tara:strand:+ start:1806 stop:2141 length:336 start_codon:yes stop_codon:yes gene_type:complete
MEFCPNCETRLKNSNESLSLVCPKCQYVKEKPGQTKKEKPAGSGRVDSELLIMDESDVNEAKGLKSTIKIHCEKCHNEEGVWWSLQTRSADEPETRFYKCVKCNHTWREYA